MELCHVFFGQERSSKQSTEVTKSGPFLYRKYECGIKYSNVSSSC